MPFVSKLSDNGLISIIRDDTLLVIVNHRFLTLNFNEFLEKKLFLDLTKMERPILSKFLMTIRQ